MKFKKNIIITILLVIIACSSSLKAKSKLRLKQNLLTSPSSSEVPVINVHIIPHTHDDAGWLANLDDYYSGNNSQGKCVKCILDNMLISLNADSKRTFTYVEMAFFEKWYSQQTDIIKENVKSLVKAGRLDFANAGWVMNDEAAVYYQHIIDQMRLGMLFLKRELDYTPRVAWSIDPFGHSLTNAYILSKLGFEKLVMVRIDFREKKKLIREKSMEFLWRPYHPLDNGESSIMTHITHGHYSPNTDRFPDLLETDYPETGFADKLDSMFNYFKDMSESYPTNELMFLFGDDFTFRNEHQNYKNIEAMVNTFQKSKYNDLIKFSYSTPTKYFNAVDKIIKESKLVLKNYDGHDFFPYSEYKMDYWTGYFTSRPYLKGLVRDAGNYLQQTNNLLFSHILSRQGEDRTKILNEIYALRRELGIAQHHDAVSGTAREAVSKDYIKRLNEGIKGAMDGVRNLIEEDFKTGIAMMNLNEEIFDSICIEAASQNECNSKVYDKTSLTKGIIFVYVNPGIDSNGLSMSKLPVKIKVKVEKGVEVIDVMQSKSLTADLICDTDLDYCVVNFLTEFSKDNLYTIIKLNSSDEANHINPSYLTTESTPIILTNNENSLLAFDPVKLTFDYKVKSSGEEYTVSFSHGFYEYHFYKDPIQKNRQGAYLMATDDETPTLSTLDINKSRYYKGTDLIQIDLVYKTSKLKLRVYPNLKEMDFIIDSESVLFPNHPTSGLEFLLIINSNVNNLNDKDKTEFYTDTNGMRIIKRVKDTRQTFHFRVDDKVASNFYPVNSLLSLREESSNKEVTVWNDRSQAGSSMSKGQILFVINRWSQRDDRKGLADGIDESNSSNVNFSLNHWVAISKNDFNVGYLQGLINKKPLYAVYTTPDVTQNQIEPVKANARDEMIQRSIQDKVFIAEDENCIEYSFYFISNSKVLIQFLNKSDPYLYSEFKSRDCKIKFKDSGLYIENIERMSLNGIDGMTDNVLSGDGKKCFLRCGKGNSVDREYMIKPLQFETFMINFITK